METIFGIPIDQFIRSAVGVAIASMILCWVLYGFWYTPTKEKAAHAVAEGELKAHHVRVQKRLADHQENLGNQIYNFAVELKDTHPDLKTRRALKVVKFPNNGGRYSVFVAEENQSIRLFGAPGILGHAIASVSVNLLNEERPLHLLRGAHGPGKDFKSPDFDIEALKEALKELVHSYTAK